MSMTMEPITVNVNDACKLTGLGQTYLKALIKDGTIESRKIGRRRLILTRSLRQFIEGNGSISIDDGQRLTVAQTLAGIWHERQKHFRINASGDDSDKLPSLNLSTFKASLHPLDRIEDIPGALDFAAHCIGEALAAAGRYDALREIFEEVEVRFGPKVASWLDHRWNGIDAGDGIWVS